ncbi:antitoxin Xre/MbcA/ParS toxin-binding domain-containing protein [Pseudomonas koreensis]|uniref:antitoxin Xre/MbcA/ParS toxin-binding domain-containing protein n=1 Tax=Pseudomonas koreensis TaxID=198620 RepID=UPI00380DDDF2
MAGISQSLNVLIKGPFMDSKQNHGQVSMTVELIQRHAEQVFGNKVKADLWLNQPIAGRGDGSRLQAAQGEPGSELVKAELERLSHGFAS